MTETIEQKIVHTLALEKTHLRLGATMKMYDGWSVPTSYGNQSQEYAVIRETGAGLIDLSSRGRLLVSGSEAISFLNGLITNDMKTLEEHHWMPAAFPNVQGRLIASVRVVRAKDEATGKNTGPGFLIDTEPLTHEAVLRILQRFTMAGDFRITDVTASMSLLSLQGKASSQVLRKALGNDYGTIGQYETRQLEWLGKQMTVVYATHTGEKGFDLFVPVEDAAKLWDALLQAGARPVGFDALEVLRVEAGQPRYGIDMDETNVVSETNLDDAVSYTKGCYIGQEIIARIKYRGHVAKKLTGVIFESISKVDGGTKILSREDKEIGRLTSVTFSPHLNRTIALGYVKYEYLAPGTPLKVNSGTDQLLAVVSELPFVSGDS